MQQRHPVLKLGVAACLLVFGGVLSGALLVDVQAWRGPSPSEIVERHINETVTTTVAVKSDDPPIPPPPPNVPYRISGPTKAVASQMVRLKADGSGASSIQWMPTSDDEFPQLIDDYVSPDAKVIERGKFFTFQMPSNAPKQTFIILVTAGTSPSMAKFTVTLDGAPQPPDPPNPPNPPNPPPDPPTPPPTPGGPFGVLILENPADRLKNPKQTEIIESTEVRAYMTAKCEKESDGKTAKWRIWKPDYTDEQVAASGGNWKDWYAKAKADSQGKLPWIIISDGKSKGESIPLPDSVPAMMALLKKYGG